MAHEAPGSVDRLSLACAGKENKFSSRSSIGKRRQTLLKSHFPSRIAKIVSKSKAAALRRLPFKPIAAVSEVNGDCTPVSPSDLHLTSFARIITPRSRTLLDELESPKFELKGQIRPIKCRLNPSSTPECSPPPSPLRHSYFKRKGVSRDDDSSGPTGDFSEQEAEIEEIFRVALSSRLRTSRHRPVNPVGRFLATLGVPGMEEGQMSEDDTYCPAKLFSDRLLLSNAVSGPYI